MKSCAAPSSLITRRAALRTILLTAAAGTLGLTLSRRGYAQEAHRMKIRISFNGMTMIATLEDNPSAQDLASMLPLEGLTD